MNSKELVKETAKSLGLEVLDVGSRKDAYEGLKAANATGCVYFYIVDDKPVLCGITVPKQLSTNLGTRFNLMFRGLSTNGHLKCCVVALNALVGSKVERFIVPTFGNKAETEAIETNFKEALDFHKDTLDFKAREVYNTRFNQLVESGEIIVNGDAITTKEEPTRLVPKIIFDMAFQPMLKATGTDISTIIKLIKDEDPETIGFTMSAHVISKMLEGYYKNI
jgi:hypothetical protein